MQLTSRFYYSHQSFKNFISRVELNISFILQVFIGNYR